MTDDREALKTKIRERLEQHHQGPGATITMTELHHAVTGETIIPWRRYDQTRLTRALIEELRREGCPIAIKGGNYGGYFWARTEAELQGTITMFHDRALSAFGQEAALKRVSAKELLKQYHLELNEQQEEHDREQASNTH